MYIRSVCRICECGKSAIISFYSVNIFYGHMRMKRYPRRIDYCIIVIEFLFDTVRNGGYNI